jgi:dTDP-4-dehydrorhamnose 3,5-epimerase
VYHPRRLKIERTELPEVIEIEPTVRKDPRGWFMETFNTGEFAPYGIPTLFAQDNHSFSKKNVIRGLHAQFDPPQGKLVRCVRGTILDIAVDIRPESPTYRKWISRELSAENHKMLWIPEGFAHGFAVLSEEAEVVYKCTTLWNAAGERAIAWNDPSIDIDWQVTNPIIGERDAMAPRLP